MSQEELVGAYVEGSISRRAFVQRLVAGGLGVGAATAYAQMLAPDAGAARRGNPAPDGNYSRFDVKILDDSLQKVRNGEKLKVRLRRTVARPKEDNLRVLVYSKDELLGKTAPRSTQGTFDVTVPLKNLGPLQGRDEAQVRVTVKHRNRTEPISYNLGSANKRLT